MKLDELKKDIKFGGEDLSNGGYKELIWKLQDYLHSARFTIESFLKEENKPTKV